MSRTSSKEIDSLVFIKCALEVATSAYESLQAERSAGKLQDSYVVRRKEREISELHARFGKLLIEVGR